MNERVRLTPEGGNEWVECLVSGDYYLELYDMDPRHSTDEFMLTEDEVLRLALLHPAVKKLVAWVKDVEAGNLIEGSRWKKGREVLAPFKEIANG